VTIVDEVRTFMRTLIREFDYLGPEGRFVTEPEYPEAVWEEAIVNALVHRSYSIRQTPVRVRLFDDRLEVESPGGFPPLARPNDAGVFPPERSTQRSPRRGPAHLRLTCLAREGTRRMRDEMLALGLPAPEFREGDRIKVIVTLRNDIARRRASPGAAPHAARWQEVRRLLGEAYAIQRRLAWDAWGRLESEGGRPPREVIEAAKTLIESGLKLPERRVALTRLFRAPADSVASVAVDWAADLGRILRALGRPEGGGLEPEAVSLLTMIVARSPEAVARVVELLEAGAAEERAKETAFACLRVRTDLEPTPSKEWLDRVVALCFASPAFGRDTYHRITGDVIP
jgi:hypothetical protein